MNVIFKILISILVVISFSVISPVGAQEDESTCYQANVHLDAQGNWPGGAVKVYCVGAQNGEVYTRPNGQTVPSDGRCPGSEGYLGPGDTVSLDRCNCYKDNCIRVDQGSIPSGCTASAGEFCGFSNQSSGPTYNVTVFCQRDESPPPPSQNACTCKYREQCTTDNGQAGTRECNGSGDQNSCRYNENCNTDCSECRPNNPPTGGPNPPPPGGNPPPGGEPPPPGGEPPPPGGEPPPPGGEPPPPGGEPPPPGGEPPPPGGEPPPPGGEPPPPGGEPPPQPPTSPSPSPTPPFSDAMCKCDGIQSTVLLPGEPATIVAGAKVEGADVRYALVRDMTFTLVEGDNTRGKILQKSNPIPAMEISRASNLVKYQSRWNIEVPALQKDKIYRIFANVSCQRRQTANLRSNLNVLGVEEEQQSFLEKIWGAFSNPFGTNPQPSPSISTAVASTMPSPSQNTPSSSKSPIDDDALQLGVVNPAQIIEKSCRFIKFQVVE